MGFPCCERAGLRGAGRGAVKPHTVTQSERPNCSRRHAARHGRALARGGALPATPRVSIKPITRCRLCAMCVAARSATPGFACAKRRMHAPYPLFRGGPAARATNQSSLRGKGRRGWGGDSIPASRMHPATFHSIFSFVAALAARRVVTNGNKAEALG